MKLKKKFYPTYRYKYISKYPVVLFQFDKLYGIHIYIYIYTKKCDVTIHMYNKCIFAYEHEKMK